MPGRSRPRHGRLLPRRGKHRDPASSRSTAVAATHHHERHIPAPTGPAPGRLLGPHRGIDRGRSPHPCRPRAGPDRRYVVRQHRRHVLGRRHAQEHQERRHARRILRGHRRRHRDTQGGHGRRHEGHPVRWHRLHAARGFRRGRQPHPRARRHHRRRPHALDRSVGAQSAGRRRGDAGLLGPPGWRSRRLERLLRLRLRLPLGRCRPLGQPGPRLEQRRRQPARQQVAPPRLHL